MSTTLLEITKQYVKEIGEYVTLLDSVAADTRSERIFATHFILQIQHRAANAVLELKNLPEKKEPKDDTH